MGKSVRSAEKHISTVTRAPSPSSLHRLRRENQAAAVRPEKNNHLLFVPLGTLGGIHPMQLRRRWIITAAFVLSAAVLRADQTSWWNRILPSKNPSVLNSSGPVSGRTVTPQPE